MERDDEVFLDAEEEFTPRRSGRKRRSTAGNSPAVATATKKPRASKMPTERSPGKAPEKGQSGRRGSTGVNQPAGLAAGLVSSAGSTDLPDLGQDKDAFWRKMGGMFSGLEARIKHETDQVKDQLGVAVSTLGELGSRVDRAEKRLDGLVEEVNMIVDKRLASKGALPEPDVGAAKDPSRSSYAVAARLGAAVVPSSLLKMQVRSPEKKREDEYWDCRRALRLRPISGGDVNEAVKDFMIEQLKLSHQFMDSVGEFTAHRVPCGPASRIQDEVIVSYQSSEVRDAVKGAAKNLAGKGQSYGVRLELPNHLKTAMSALQSASFEIKQKFPQARRNVLFDDGTMDLVLDFSTGEGKPWKRITSTQARDRKKKAPARETAGRATLGDGELDSLLDRSRRSSTDEDPV